MGDLSSNLGTFSSDGVEDEKLSAQIEPMTAVIRPVDKEVGCQH
jgi:hypothetical protein